jgi:hypothetical protein
MPRDPNVASALQLTLEVDDRRTPRPASATRSLCREAGVSSMSAPSPESPARSQRRSEPVSQAAANCGVPYLRKVVRFSDARAVGRRFGRPRGAGPGLSSCQRPPPSSKSGSFDLRSSSSSSASAKWRSQETLGSRAREARSESAKLADRARARGNRRLPATVASRIGMRVPCWRQAAGEACVQASAGIVRVGLSRGRRLEVCGRAVQPATV